MTDIAAFEQPSMFTAFGLPAGLTDTQQAILPAGRTAPGTNSPTNSAGSLSRSQRCT